MPTSPGVYFLRRGGRRVVEALTPRLALARLLADVLFFAREPDVTATVFGIADLTRRSGGSLDMRETYVIQHTMRCYER
jgi:hypothetical protein